MNQSNSMRILLIGHNGQVGWELQRTLASLGTVIVVDRSSTRFTIDLRDEHSIRSTVKAINPDLIVNAAAYTAVDKAETDVATAEAVNAIAPGILAQSAGDCGAGLVHYSTDYVFPGVETQPYREDDEKAPINVYGETKLKGELAIQAVGIPHFILRTSWVYGVRGKNFLLTMLRLMKERDSFGVVNDQVGSPTQARQIAEATAMMIAKSSSNAKLSFSNGGGTYHMTNAGETSWFSFAQTIQEIALRRGILASDSAVIHPIDSAAFRTDAARPQYSVLNNDKLKQDYDLQLPEWSQSLDLCLYTMGMTHL
jgi:dTDP-4-dehydrorhamnose reductase